MEDVNAFGNNSVYLGNLVNNIRRGRGYRLYPNKKVYIGDFVDGLKEGKGILLNQQGEIQYEGDYLEDKMHGKGKVLLPEKFLYYGELENDNITGMTSYRGLN